MAIERTLAAVSDTARKAATAGGAWRNRIGSVMQLDIGADGAITGTFRTAVGAPHPSRTYHLSGYAHGEAVSFCVDFNPHGSVAAWVGHHVTDEHGERLVTLYHLATPVTSPRSDADLWQSVIAGADEFTRTGD